jgi:TonB family protein
MPTCRVTAQLLTLVAVCASGCAHERVAPSVARTTEPRVALGMRARPFAQFITAMHRLIHRHFTLEFLTDIDARNDPTYADQTLWAQLELAVDSDGTLARLGVVRSSGLQSFDDAAIASVRSAAPFPPPPAAIASADGKVYLDWRFFRDERACGTFGVDPHILDAVGAPVPHDTSEVPAVGSGRSAPLAPPRSSALTEAGAAVEGWLAAYRRGDVAWLAGWSATPFTADGEVIARDASALEELYRNMVSSSSGQRSITSVSVLTVDQLLGRFGGLPPGGEPSQMMYGVALVDGKQIFLLLKKSSQGWRVCGLDR